MYIYTIKHVVKSVCSIVMEQALDALLSRFSAQDKAAWARQVEKDLKGRPWTDLRWALEEGLVIDPIYHPDWSVAPRGLLATPRAGRRWAIGEAIEVDSFTTANILAKEAIAGGVDSPGFLLLHRPDENQLNQLLTGIDPRGICLNFGEFYPDKAPLTLLRLLLDWCHTFGYDAKGLRGSIDFDPFLDWTDPPLNELTDAINLCRKEAPGFKILQVNGRYYHAGPSETVNELGMIIAKGAEYLACMEESGIPAATTHHFIQFSVALSTDYFVEIAKLRALRILWHNVLKGFDLQSPEPLEIIAHLAPETQDKNIYTNMIRAGSQAMAAVIGGADRLYLLPANTALQEAPESFTRRIARNVQHLLDLEAHLGKVADPAAGSWYIENLTSLLVEKSWERFLELERNEAFRLRNSR
jgi:methylmalonyl-CoA mutase